MDEAYTAEQAVAAIEYLATKATSIDADAALAAIRWVLADYRDANVEVSS